MKIGVNKHKERAREEEKKRIEKKPKVTRVVTENIE